MAPPRGWSSLPAELVNLVGDCLLATNDLDCYTDLRAVCQHWRSSTADPRSEPYDRRFTPTRWLMLGEIEYKRDARRDDDDKDPTRLFVNTATGRFVRRRLPFLRGYRLVTTSTGGFLVVEDDAGPPFATWVVNPFTGSSIRFKALVPPGLGKSMIADVVVISDDPTLILAAWSSLFDCFMFYLADPESKEFDSLDLTSKSLRVGLLHMLVRGDSASSPMLVLPWHAVEVAPGEILLPNMMPLPGRKRGVFRINPAFTDIEEVTSIGDYALFVGNGRCICVRADSFPSIAANCIYFKDDREILYPADTYCLYDLAHRRVEIIARPGIFPATIAQLIVDYAMCSGDISSKPASPAAASDSAPGSASLLRPCLGPEGTEGPAFATLAQPGSISSDRLEL